MGRKERNFTKDGFLHSKTAPLRILDSVYAKRCSLLKYVQSNDPDNALRLFDNSTSPELKHLLRTSIVACGVDKDLVLTNQHKISYKKHFTLNELVDRCIRFICHGKGECNAHIISQGYKNQPCGVPDLFNLKVLYPNSMTSYIRSGPWKELHDRIGSDLIMYMLRHLNVFVKEKSSCYFQVTGQPVDQIVPKKLLHKRGKVRTKPRKEQDSNLKSQSASIRWPVVTLEAQNGSCQDEAHNCQDNGCSNCSQTSSFSESSAEVIETTKSPNFSHVMAIASDSAQDVARNVNTQSAECRAAAAKSKISNKGQNSDAAYVISQQGCKSILNPTQGTQQSDNHARLEGASFASLAPAHISSYASQSNFKENMKERLTAEKGCLLGELSDCDGLNISVKSSEVDHLNYPTDLDENIHEGKWQKLDQYSCCKGDRITSSQCLYGDSLLSSSFITLASCKTNDNTKKIHCAAEESLLEELMDLKKSNTSYYLENSQNECLSYDGDCYFQKAHSESKAQNMNNTSDYGNTQMPKGKLSTKKGANVNSLSVFSTKLHAGYEATAKSKLVLADSEKSSFEMIKTVNLSSDSDLRSPCHSPKSCHATSTAHLKQNLNVKLTKQASCTREEDGEHMSLSNYEPKVLFVDLTLDSDDENVLSAECTLQKRRLDSCYDVDNSNELVVLQENIQREITEDVCGQPRPTVDLNANHDNWSSKPVSKKRRLDSGGKGSSSKVQAFGLCARRSTKRCSNDPSQGKSKKCKIKAAGTSNKKEVEDAEHKHSCGKTVKHLGRKPHKRKRKKNKVVLKPKITFLKRNIFHSTSVEKFFGRDHIMETTPASARGARALIEEIFSPCVRSSAGITGHLWKKPKRLPKRLVQCEKTFKQLLVRHKSCPFKRLLNKHCPQLSEMTSQKIAEGVKSNDLKDIGYSQVLGFCRAICKRVIPLKLWGSKYNMDTFLKNLYQFISLRKREKFSLQQILKGIKVNDCVLLKTNQSKNNPCSLPASEFLSRQKLLSDFYLWLMDSYFTPLLKNAFTITESAVSRNRVFYYRKFDWQNMSQTVTDQLTETVLEPITKGKAEELILAGKSLGYSLLRLLPKDKGARPVVNMSLRNMSLRSGKALSINQQLINAFDVLTYERKAFPGNLGVANFGLDDVYHKLVSFSARHKEMKEKRPLYFVRLDISKCYDSIQQAKMLDIIKDVLTEDEYIIRRHCCITLGQGNSVKKEYKRVASPIDECESFPKFVKDTVKNSNLRNAILVDQVNYASVRKEAVVKSLTKHITCNIVKLAGSYYRQTCGIAQGSVVSPLLCNYYFGHLENKEFSNILSDPDSLLLRWVDDFLLITYSLDYAKKFLFSMLAGFPEYNCAIKLEKSLVNFEAVTPSGELVRHLAENDVMMPWCSMLINTQTLEVQADYSRYEGKDAMKDSLTVDLGYHPGSSISQKLKFSILPKCQRVFVDLGLNTEKTVLINMYQTFLYTAQRFHAHASELPKDQQVRHNPRFFRDELSKVVTYYYNRVVRIIHDAIPRDVVFCLFTEAVLSVLRRKPARYTGLLEMFTKQKKQFPNDVQEKAFHYDEAISKFYQPFYQLLLCRVIDEERVRMENLEE